MRAFMRTVAHLILRIGALLAPAHRREDMIAEWGAELDREIQAGHGWAAVANALGAFPDGWALRQLERGRVHAHPADTFVSRWGHDIRLALRSLARAPGFSAVSVLTLAIGLGAAAAIFTLIERVVLAPLPYPDAERLVRLENQVPGVGPDERWAMSTAQQVFFSDNARTLERVGLYRQGGANVMTPSGAERARTANVTSSTVTMLGARASLGRLITPADDDPSASRVAMVSHGFWERALEGDASAIGRTIELDGQPVEVIGVVAEGIRLPGERLDRAPEIWVPLRIDRGATFYNNHAYPGIALIAEGFAAADAEAEIQALAARLPEAFPNAYTVSFFERYGFRTVVTPLRASVVGDMAGTLWVLFGGVALVLVVACGNVANLFLVRVEGRRRELSLRRALGADRAAITRYVLSEGMVLAIAGGLVGLVVAFATLPLLVRLAPETLPRLDDVALGSATVAFTFMAAVAVGLLVSVYPITSSNPAASDLAGGGRGSSAGPARQRVRSTLVVTQMATAVALLVGAGLLVESLDTLQAADPGFAPDDVVAVDVYASSVRYPNDVALWGLHRDILTAVRSIPGVGSAGMGEEVPVDGGYGCTVQGFEEPVVYQRVEDAGLTTCAGQEVVTPGYFDALGIPLLEGRLLDAGDNDDPARASVVVSRAFADRFWPGESAIGKGVAPGGRTEPPFFHVVGVVGDVARSADDGAPPLSQKAIAIYYPGVNHPDVRNWGGWWPGMMTLVVRGDVADATLLPAVRQALAAIDPQLPLSNERRMADVVDAASADVSFLSTLMLIAAAAALMLAAVGLYGVVSWAVSRRTREIGTRLAIGAAPATVVRSVITATLALAGIGIAAGLPLALLTSRLARGVLVGVEPTSLTAYVSAAGAVALVSALAAWLPARRAAAIDPAESLRAD